MQYFVSALKEMTQAKLRP